MQLILHVTYIFLIQPILFSINLKVYKFNKFTRFFCCLVYI